LEGQLHDFYINDTFSGVVDVKLTVFQCMVDIFHQNSLLRIKALNFSLAHFEKGSIKPIWRLLQKGSTFNVKLPNGYSGL
jgi:hypothetical protein